MDYRLDFAHTAGGHVTPSATAPEKTVSPVVDQKSAAPAAATISPPSPSASSSAQMRERQGELDHHESHLDARVAQIDQELRSARLWIAEQQALLKQRQEHLAAIKVSLSQCEAAIESRILSLAELTESLTARSVNEGSSS